MLKALFNLRIFAELHMHNPQLHDHIITGELKYLWNISFHYIDKKWKRIIIPHIIIQQERIRCQFLVILVQKYPHLRNHLQHKNMCKGVYHQILFNTIKRPGFGVLDINSPHLRRFEFHTYRPSTSYLFDIFAVSSIPITESNSAFRDIAKALTARNQKEKNRKPNKISTYRAQILPDFIQ